jgi:uridylate kinase
VDEAFLKDFHGLVRDLFAADEKRRLILVAGGGGPARAWQKAYRNIRGGGSDEEADWIGVMATRLNAQLVKAVMGEWCTQDVVTNPTQVDFLAGRLLVAAGWKPGFSSDYDAVLLAERFQADRLINLSNIDQVYTGDPRKNPQAKPIDAISWADFRVLVGDAWRPGLNLPFDPVASRHAAKIGLQVVCAGGRNLENLKKLFRGEPFLGTVIG